jgi:hypothetical protein
MSYFKSNGEIFEGTVFDANEKKGIAYYSFQDKCHKCGGAGGRPEWNYTGWVCFRCGGSGLEAVKTDKVYNAVAYAKMDAARAKRAIAKKIKDDIKVAEYKAKQEEIAATIREKGLAFSKEHSEEISFLNNYQENLSNENAKYNDFLSSLYAMFDKNGYLSDNQLASIQKMLAAKKELSESSFIDANIGDKIEKSLTLVKAFTFKTSYSYYSCSTIYIMKDEDGNYYKYCGSTGKNVPEVIGETRKIQFTIKEFSTYNDMKQTVIARPKLLDSIAA